MAETNTDIKTLKYTKGLNKLDFNRKDIKSQFNYSACVYQITNISNNKIYIGSTIIPYNRLLMHYRSLNRGDHENIYLQRAWNKYGKDNFEFEILDKIVFKEQSKDYRVEYTRTREQFYLNDKLKADNDLNYFKSNGYNMRPDAFSPEGCEISEKAKNRLKKEFRDKESNSSKKVFKFDLEGNLLETYNSATEANTLNKATYSKLRVACKNTGFCKGFIWSYSSEIDISKVDIPTRIYRNKVYCYNILNECVLYNRLTLCMEKLNIKKEEIIKSINTKCRTSEGFLFSYQKLNINGK